MYPNPNSWIFLKALEDERWRRTQREQQFRAAVKRRPRVDWTDIQLFSGFRQQIDSIRLKLRPVEGRSCPDCCPDVCATALVTSL